MAEDLGLRCRVKPWSENLNRVHDEYVVLKNKAKLDGLCTLSLIRDDYIKAEAEHFVKFAAELGITATVLDSEYLLAKEGAEMHHCVGSYSWDVREGECLIFGLEKDGHRSTLQLSKTRGSQGQHIGWHVGQNYAKHKHNTRPHESLCIRTEVHADQVKTGYLRMEAFGLA
jgi:hypothetical protein